jgi:FkbM family methyltransferase
MPTPAEPLCEEVLIPGGIRLTVPADIRLMTPFVLAEQGDWFEAEIRFVRRLLRPGEAMVDVGANYGLYTSAGAVAVGSAGRVWSFEPATQPHRALSQTIAANHLDQVTLYQTALSDHRGSARLGVQPNAELNSLAQADGDGEEVPLSTLDAEVEFFDHPVVFLKLDAEGEEIRILSASSAFFARHDPLVMFEFKHGSQVNHGLIEAVRNLGMEIYQYLPGPGVLAPLDEARAADGFLLNLFGCRRAMAEGLMARGLLVDERSSVAPEFDAQTATRIVGSWLKTRPWVTGLWPSGLPQMELPGGADYLAALADGIVAQKSGVPTAERVVRLRRALVRLRVACTQHPSVPRLLTISRVLADLGLQSGSLHALNEAVVQCSRAKSLSENAGNVLRFSP